MRSHVDPQRARELYGHAAFRAWAAHRKLNKDWSQLDVEAKESWCCAADEVCSAVLSTLDQEDTFLMLLKSAMRDALTDDHISQLQTMFVGKGGIPGKVRLIVAPDRMTHQFAAPLEGRHDG